MALGDVRLLARALLRELTAAQPVCAAAALWRGLATRQGPPVARLGIPGVSHIIAVASGKGGVCKSTTAGGAPAMPRSHLNRGRGIRSYWGRPTQ